MPVASSGEGQCSQSVGQSGLDQAGLVEQEVSHVPVASSGQGQDLVHLPDDELLVVELHPRAVGLLDPRHVVAAVC